jgi:nucleoside-diphosphate-sugar epimerase
LFFAWASSISRGSSYERDELAVLTDSGAAGRLTIIVPTVHVDTQAMSKVLVTGGSGFIGGHLVRRLFSQGDEVTCLVRDAARAESLAHAGARLVLGDVTDYDSLRRALADHAVVYHLAGLTMALRLRELMHVNVEGARNVAQACAELTTPPVLVAASSIAVAGPTRGRPCVENDEPRPVSNYGRSKLAGEMALRDLAGRVPISIVRPPIVFGEGDRASLPLFTSIVRWGVHMAPSLWDRRYSVIHVDDLASAMIQVAARGSRLAADVELGRGVYYASAEETPTYAQLGRMIGTAVGRRRVLVIRHSRPVVMLVAAAGELAAQIRRRPIIFGLDKAREATAGGWECSCDALRREVGFHPARPLDARLRQTAAWYAQQGWIGKPTANSREWDVEAEAIRGPG